MHSIAFSLQLLLQVMNANVLQLSTLQHACEQLVPCVLHSFADTVKVHITAKLTLEINAAHETPNYGTIHKLDVIACKLGGPACIPNRAV